MSSLLFVPLYLLHLVLFLAPGLLLAVLLARRLALPTYFTPLIAVVFSTAIGYATFWVYFFDHTAGRAVGLAVLGVTAYYLLRPHPWTAAFWRAVADRDVRTPLILMALLGLFYLSLVYAVAFRHGPDDLVRDRFALLFPASDCVIPWQFAERLYHGLDPRRLVGDWLSSDRPPLQTGLVLLQGPVIDLVGLAGEMHYEALGTAIQVGWVAAVWALGRQAQLDGRRLAWVFAFLASAGFFYFNTVYVWPKMLSATLALVPVSLLYLRGGQRLNAAQALLAGAAAALGVLAHSGVVFALFALALFLLRPRLFPGVPHVLLMGMAFAAFVLPWLAYQRYYEPPGNRLVKWHLAGAIDIDDRSFGRALSDGYLGTPPDEVLANKRANVQALFGWPFIAPTWYDEGPCGHWRNGEYHALLVVLYNHWHNGGFYNVVKALGVLNIGWLVLLASYRKRSSLRNREEVAAARRLLALGVIGLLVWVVLMYGPGTTLVHQNSYATMLLLFTGLAVLAAALPRWCRAGLLFLLVADLVVFWAVPAPYDARPDAAVIVFAVVALAGVAGFLVRLGRANGTRRNADAADGRGFDPRGSA